MALPPRGSDHVELPNHVPEVGFTLHQLDLGTLEIELRRPADLHETPQLLDLPPGDLDFTLEAPALQRQLHATELP
jgi:hypothetical protein